MNYRDIISDNCKSKSQVSWWPRFAYHFTNVTNAVNILDLGYIYSRTNAAKQDLIKNDTASKQVIDITSAETKSFVRFYFRPLTPTQYYNEGYKHPKLRFSGDNSVNMPVPIFFAFNLEKVLSMPGTLFSETAQAGGGSQRFSGVESFSKLDFEKIYSDGPCSNFEDIKKYRHAEILYPNQFPIHDSLEAILCRNATEQITLLTLLKLKNETAYYQYNGR